MRIAAEHGIERCDLLRASLLGAGQMQGVAGAQCTRRVEGEGGWISRLNRVYVVPGHWPLTMAMVWRLRTQLGIPAESPIQPPKLA